MTGLREIANSVALQVITPVVYPNDVVNAGIINDNYEPIKQVPFLLSFAKPHLNTYYDTSYQYETGRGEIPVPYSNDYYMGEVL